MKLLLDANLSYRLVKKLAVTYDHIVHINSCGLGTSPSDQTIWEWAKRNDYAIVTNDEDFQHLAVLYGTPPKVVLLRTGNQSSLFISQLLTEKKQAISEFLANADLGVLEIY
jgi:predicted nuclease of predicted toxin-antitoxin system